MDLKQKDELEKKGYFIYINGIQSYNGVAILSKIEATKIDITKIVFLGDLFIFLK